MDAMKASPADAFKVSLEAGDLVIEFGKVIEPAASQGEAAVAVTDRVVLPLDIGRRLIHWLEDSLKPHAAGLRAAQAKALSPAEAAAALRPGQAPAQSPLDAASDTAALLLRLIGDLGVPHQYERSFRVSEGALA